MISPDRIDRFDTPPEGILIRGLDGTWRRGDGKPLDKWDKRIAAGEDALKVQLEACRASELEAEAEAWMAREEAEAAAREKEEAEARAKVEEEAEAWLAKAEAEAEAIAKAKDEKR